MGWLMSKIKSAISMGAAFVVFGNLSVSVACEVRLKSTVPSCPMVAYSAEDCNQESRVGKKGDRISFTILHVMSSGAVFASGNRNDAIELKYLTFKGCKFIYMDRKNDESAEYVSHFIIE